MLCHDFVLKRCLGRLEEEGVYKLPLTSIPKRCETILAVLDKAPQSRSKGSGFPLVEGLGTDFRSHKQHHCSDLKSKR